MQVVRAEYHVPRRPRSVFTRGPRMASKSAPASTAGLALERGHVVTAYVRSPRKIACRDAALSVVEGDPLRADRLAQALPGHDAVLSAVGPPPRDAFRKSTLLAECAASTVAAMRSAGV